MSCRQNLTFTNIMQSWLLNISSLTWLLRFVTAGMVLGYDVGMETTHGNEQLFGRCRHRKEEGTTNFQQRSILNIYGQNWIGSTNRRNALSFGETISQVSKKGIVRHQQVSKKGIVRHQWCKHDKQHNNMVLIVRMLCDCCWHDGGEVGRAPPVSSPFLGRFLVPVSGPESYNTAENGARQIKNGGLAFSSFSSFPSIEQSLDCRHKQYRRNKNKWKTHKVPKFLPLLYIVGASKCFYDMLFNVWRREQTLRKRREAFCSSKT